MGVSPMSSFSKKYGRDAHATASKMSLTILQAHSDPTSADLLRYYARAQLHWARHVGEESALDVGTAFSNPQLPGAFYANRILDASLPEGVSPGQAMTEVTAHFTAVGTRCRTWEMNPATPARYTEPMADHLLALGYVRDICNVMYLKNFPAEALREVGDLKIIPARASFKHMRVLAEESALRWNAPDLAEAKMLHLDDSHTDALLALRNSLAVGYMAVLSVGEIGAIQDLFVSAAYRRLGIGRTLMSRALEICARSLFKHVFIGVAPDNTGAIALYERCGFRKIGETVSYRC